jgi:hypothetical protein
MPKPKFYIVWRHVLIQGVDTVVFQVILSGVAELYYAFTLEEARRYRDHCIVYGRAA